MANSSEINQITPTAELKKRSNESGLSIIGRDFARYLDENDELASFRDKFVIPKNATVEGVDLSTNNPEKKCIYLCGHSLGLRPKSCKKYIDIVIEEWDKRGAGMHTQGFFPVAYCDIRLKPFLAELTGAYEDEVSAMNALTVNLNLLSLSFYKPVKERCKIMIEYHSFCSDLYAMQSLLKFYGYDPEKDLIEIKPREGEEILRDEDIIDYIERRGHEIAMIILPGVQYYTGQLFDMKKITEVGHNHGCVVGFDLAHAIGNVKLELHDWDVDFAVWCSYKYLSCGAGAIGGAFLHRRNKNVTPVLTGWWSCDVNSRFEMKKKLELSAGINAYKISNPSTMMVAMCYASFEIYHEAGMKRISQKQFLLTGYLEYLLEARLGGKHLEDLTKEENRNIKALVNIITPKNPKRRGSQLSLSFSVAIEDILVELTKQGILLDSRNPNVIRVGALPLYSSFMDVFEFVEKLKIALEKIK